MATKENKLNPELLETKTLICDRFNKHRLLKIFFLDKAIAFSQYLIGSNWL